MTMSVQDTVAPNFDPARTALLLMDFQQGVLAGLTGADALVARVAATLAIARQAGVTIVHVRVALTDVDRGTMPAANLMFAMLASRGLFADDAPSTRIASPVAPIEGERIVRKARVGALRTTGLAEDLRAASIDTLILAGVHTSGVVLSTLRDAADLDFRIIVAADLCADPDEDVHGLLVDTLFPRQALVVSSAALASALG